MTETVNLISPRGYCAGVERAIETVDRLLEERGAPVYVRGEIVHNQYVVRTLADKGAVFVDTPEEVPEGSVIVLSAHGSAPDIYERCAARELEVIDATCPLVSKVHAEVRRFAGKGATVLLVGHQDHDEVIGTRGEAPDRVIVVEDVAQAEIVEVPDPDNVALTTQTTLSLDDTAEILSVLKARFPELPDPHKEDICYATTNRQEAVKAIAPQVELLLVVGAPNSSNSRRLVEVGERNGTPRSMLVQRAAELDWSTLQGLSTVGITAGASAPELLVNEIIDAFRAHYEVSVEQVTLREENVSFKLPRELREVPATP